MKWRPCFRCRCSSISLGPALVLRTRPYTSYPRSSNNSERYEPSWPVTPVINARFISLLYDETRLSKSGVVPLGGAPALPEPLPANLVSLPYFRKKPHTFLHEAFEKCLEIYTPISYLQALAIVFCAIGNVNVFRHSQYRARELIP